MAAFTRSSTLLEKDRTEILPIGEAELFAPSTLRLGEPRPGLVNVSTPLLHGFWPLAAAFPPRETQYLIYKSVDTQSAPMR